MKEIKNVNGVPQIIAKVQKCGTCVYMWGERGVVTQWLARLTTCSSNYQSVVSLKAPAVSSSKKLYPLS